MNWLEQWFEEAKEIISSPTEFYQVLRKRGNFSYPIKFAVTSGIIGAILTGLVDILLGTKTNPLMMFPSAIVGGIIAGTVGLLIGAGIIHIFVYLFDGYNYQKTLEAISYTTAIQALVGWIPYVGIIAWAYTVYAQIRGIEEFHEFSTGRAAAVVLIPIGIGIGISIAVLAWLFYTLGGISLSTLQGSQAYSPIPQTVS